MTVTSKLKIDLEDGGIRPPVPAVQYDGGTRILALSLYAGGEAWTPPAEAAVSVAFRKPDGTSGRYDTLPDGTKACAVSGNTVTAVLAPQVLTAAGQVKVAVVFQNTENLNQIAAFPVTVAVAPNPGAGKGISSDYYNYQTLAQVNDALGAMEVTVDSLASPVAALTAKSAVLDHVTEVRGSQLLDISTNVKGKYFDEENELYSTSRLIRVRPGHTLYFYRYDDHSQHCFWGFQGFDPLGKLLRTVQLYNSGVWTTAYDNTDMAYIRVTGQTSAMTLNVVEEDAQTVTAQTPCTPPSYLFDGRVSSDKTQELEKLVEGIPERVSELEEKSTNSAQRLSLLENKSAVLDCVSERTGAQLLDLSTIETGRYFDSDNAAYFTSQPIKVEPGHTVYFYRYDDHSRHELWGFQGFDEAGKLLRTVQLYHSGVWTTAYDNTDMAYIRVSGRTDSRVFNVVEQDGQTVTTQTAYTPPAYVFDQRIFCQNNVLHGKSLLVLGDSITYGEGVGGAVDKTWGGIIARRNGMTFTNAGISGSTMGAPTDKTGTHPSYQEGRHTAIDGKDYAIIWFGWNDYNFCQLGTAGTPDETTFLGAYYSTLAACVRNYPTAKIGVIIPYIYTYAEEDPQGYGILELQNGLKKVCELNGIPYLDINRYNFIQSFGSDYPASAQWGGKYTAKSNAFTSDGLHPNEAGNEYLSTVIENFLRSL